MPKLPAFFLVFAFLFSSSAYAGFSKLKGASTCEQVCKAGRARACKVVKHQHFSVVCTTTGEHYDSAEPPHVYCDCECHRVPCPKPTPKPTPTPPPTPTPVPTSSIIEK